METHSKTHRNYLILALVAAGMLLVGVFSLHSGVTISAEAAAPAPRPAPPPTVRPHTCKGIERVVVSNHLDNFVDPETFTLCQGGSRRVHMLRWEKAKDATFVTFEAKFENGTPFAKDGVDQSDFSFGPGESFVMTPPTKDLHLSPGQAPVYFKYKVTLCYDEQKTNCEDQDPGGVIQP